MSNQGIRVSSNRTAAVGNRNADWTMQSARFYKTKVGDGTQIKMQRRRTLRNQLMVLPSAQPVTDATINRVEAVRIEKDGKVQEVYEGYYKGKRVRRMGYAYALVKNGETPGRWLYVH